MITCRELTGFLMDYVDGALDGQQREAFERHLAACPPCVDYLASYRATVELTRELAAPPPADAPAGDATTSGAIPEELVRAVLAARREGGDDRREGDGAGEDG